MPKKPLPKLTSDAAAERFVDEADLSQYDLSAFKAHSFRTQRATSEHIAQIVGNRGLIGIDGWTGVGKTTVGKELSQITGRHSFLDLDSFLVRDRECYVEALKLDDLATAIRTERKPIVLSGVCLLEALAKIEIRLDAHIYLKRINAGVWADEEEAVGDGLAVWATAGFEPSKLSCEIHAYHLAYRPHENADFILEICHE